MEPLHDKRFTLLQATRTLRDSSSAARWSPEQRLFTRQGQPPPNHSAFDGVVGLAVSALLKQVFATEEAVVRIFVAERSSVWENIQNFVAPVLAVDPLVDPLRGAFAFFGSAGATAGGWGVGIMAGSGELEVSPYLREDEGKGYFGHSTESRLLVHMWSLSVEDRV